MQNVWKRLRKAGYRIRYFAAPELGDERARHHYHALIYGLPKVVAARSVWKQGYTHARWAKEGDLEYVAEYAAKQSGRKMASAGYGSIPEGVLNDDEVFNKLGWVASIPNARIAGIGALAMPSRQRKLTTERLRKCGAGRVNHSSRGALSPAQRAADRS